MKKITFTLTMLLIFSLPVMAQFSLDIESGAVFSGYNDVRIPGDEGTLFSLSRELKADPGFFYRVRINYALSDRNVLSLLFAPLSITSSGQFEEEVFFAGETFPADIPVEGLYKFNSYRLTWRYALYRSDAIDFGLGFTAKIRDAEIRLETDDLVAKKTNVGFVPIINFKFLWRFKEPLNLLIEGDALAAPQGRAEDVLFAFTYNASSKFVMKAGYRILEGGADNDEVYNFALINYAVVGFFIYL